LLLLVTILTSLFDPSVFCRLEVRLHHLGRRDRDSERLAARASDHPLILQEFQALAKEVFSLDFFEPRS